MAIYSTSRLILPNKSPDDPFRFKITFQRTDNPLRHIAVEFPYSINEGRVGIQILVAGAIIIPIGNDYPWHIGVGRTVPILDGEIDIGDVPEEMDVLAYNIDPEEPHNVHIHIGPAGVPVSVFQEFLARRP